MIPFYFHRKRQLDLYQPENAQRWLPYLAAVLVCAQNIVGCAVMRRRFESLLQHHAQSTVEVFENKAFLPIVKSREVDIALSMGSGGADHRKPCTTKGRQEQWYKDFWLSQLQRSWRLLRYRAAKTVNRCKLRQMQPHNSRSTTTSWFTDDCFLGWALRPVRFFPQTLGGAHG